MKTLADRLRAACKANPNVKYVQASHTSAKIRRNRLRIGLPELPTKEEMKLWAKKEKARRRGR